MDNYAIADQFSMLAKLMDIHGENSFKSKSYSAAAFSIEKLPVQLSETPSEKIAGFKGIGESTAKKIQELLNTGQLQSLQDLIAKTPPGILEMMQIKGLGPKKIATIWKEMGLESLGELLYACNENRLLLFKGFGEKTQESVKQAIQFYFQHQGHFLYAEIEPYVLQLEKTLLQQFPDYPSSLTGELRRQATIITRPELITTVPAAELLPYLQSMGFETTQQEASIAIKSAEGICLYLLLTGKENFITQRFVTSCSEDFLRAWREYTKFDETASYASEEALFHQYDLNPIPVFLRETAAIAELSKQSGQLKVITVADIKGIIHAHSNWSDGLHSLETMAKACMDSGLEYLVISDHSRSAFYANGLSVERIRDQHKQIDELNARLAPFKIFKSIECDILTDGSLDYEDAVLQSFDLVICSVHSNLKMPEEKAMQRLLKAIRHPATTILGHPTGRLLLSRPGYPVNHRQLIDACVEHKVVLEINAHPRRLDLDWSWIPYALEKGCLLSINPDAHQTEGYEDLRFGVLSAQKGGLPASHNLSSFSRSQLEAYLLEKRNRG